MKKINRFLKPYYIIILIIALWYLISYLGIWNTYLLPTPWKVCATFKSMLLKGELLESILVSFKRVLVGFGISFVFAFIAGMISSFFTSKSEYFSHINNFMRNVPPISLISLLILWFGIGEISKLVIIILASFYPMNMNIAKGFKECDKKLVEVGKSLGFSKLKIFWRIYLPYAKEDILVGMRIGLGYSWRALIGAEMFAASSGLGYMIVFAQQMSRSDKVIIGILLIGLIGSICDKLFSLFIRKICVGGKKNV